MDAQQILLRFWTIVVLEVKLKLVIQSIQNLNLHLELWELGQGYLELMANTIQTAKSHSKFVSVSVWLWIHLKLLAPGSAIYRELWEKQKKLDFFCFSHNFL